MLKYIAIILLWAVGHHSQAQSVINVKGSGYILTQQRETAFFNSIEVSQNISVYIVQGKFQPITVEADNNLFNYIKTVVRNNTLKIYIPDTVNIVKFTHMNILISMPELKLLQASQTSLIEAAPQLWKIPDIQLYASTGSRIRLAVQTSDIKVSAKTSAIIELQGKAQTMEAKLKTASLMYARNFEVGEANIELATGSKAEIRVNDKILYDLCGNSKLTYKGNPQITKKSVNTGSKVIHDK
ncbi:MAG: DUF2807 domain-containing protein [Odoribacter sp.]|nr:DUF2807 domain-containing protein [Odoribacter sp.]